MGAAGLVTLLTVAGQVGIGPGAASAQTPTHQQQVASTGASSEVTPPASDSPSGDGTGSDGTTDNGWLKIDDGPKVHDTSPSATALPPDTGSGRRIVYDISAQRVWLVDADDSVERTYLVSGGKDPDLLDPGHYNVSSMSRDAVSYNHKETMQYMVRFASGDHAPIGFHDIPARPDGTLVQTKAELGTPLSSGCIRQWIRDARALYEFAAVDTPVEVTA